VLAREWRRAARYGRSLSCLMIDIDDFKLFNDNFGHLVGDEILRQVASRVVSSVRETDTAARFGGEEFCVLLPETTAEGAEDLAWRVLSTVSGQPFLVECAPVSVAVSIGVGLAAPDTDDGPEALVAHADVALSKAKAAGKNRVQGIASAQHA
jgi:two-component system cell cycle response regulator